MAAWGVGIYLLLYVAGVLMMWQRMLRLVIKPLYFDERPIEDLSEEERELFEHWCTELECIGFEVAGAFSTRELFEGLVEPQPGLAMRHRERHDTWALLVPNASADPRLPVALILHTPTEGALVTTMNDIGAGTPITLRGSVEVDPDVLDFKDQWSAHLATVQELAPTTPDAPIEFSVMVSKLFDLDRRLIGEMLELGIVRGSPEEGMHLRLWAGFKWSLQIVKAGRRRQQRMVRAGAAKPEVKVPLAAKMMAFRRLEKVFAGPSPTLFWAWLLFGSFLLLPISLLGFVEMQGALVILGVLTVHELGHYAAMRLFRYQDTRIFFIPFFGGAAVGKQRDASLSQEMIVLLAGPMPGILIALALVLFSPNFSDTGVGGEIVFYGLVLNILNLLPIFPLDGGRVVHRLLLGRNPFVETGFRLLGAALFVVAGLAYGDMIVLAIGGFSLFGIPQSLRMSKFETRLRQQAPLSEQEEERLHRLFKTHSEDPTMQGKALSTPVVRQLLDRLGMPRVSGASLGSWLAVYCGCFVVIFMLGVLTVIVNRSEVPIAFYERDWLALPTEQVWDCSATRDNESNSTRMAVFSCTTPSEDEAIALLDFLDEKATGGCPQPAWKISSTHAEERNAHRKARRTLRLISTYFYELHSSKRKQRSSLAYQIDENSTKEETQDAVDALEREFARRQKEDITALRTYVDKQGATLGLDAETAELFVAQFEPGINNKDGEMLWRELNTRLGCGDEGGEPTESYVMNASVEGDVFRLAALLAPGPSMSQLANYLCAAGCEPLLYGVEKDLPSDY